MEYAKQVIQNLQNYSGHMPQQFDFESGMQLLNILAKLEYKEFGQPKDSLKINQNLLLQSPSLMRKYSDMGQQEIQPNSSQIAHQKPPLQQEIKKPIFKLKKLNNDSQIKIYQILNSQKVEKKFNFDDLINIALQSQQTSEFKLMHLIKLNSIHIQYQLKKSNYEYEQSIMNLTNQEIKILALMRQLSCQALYKVCIYWLVTEINNSEQSRYEELLNQLMNILYPINIQEIIDNFSEWKQFIEDIPIVNSEVFRYLFQVICQKEIYLRQINWNEIKEIDPKRYEKIHSFFQDLINVFKQLIINQLGNINKAQQGIYYFIRLNNDISIRIVNNTFWGIQPFKEIITQHAYLRLELMKKQPSLEAQQEFDPDIESFGNKFSTASTKFYISLLDKKPDLLNNLFNQFQDLSIAVQDLIIKKLSLVLKIVQVDVDLLKNCFLDFALKENLAECIADFLIKQKKHNIIEEIFLQLNYFVVNSRKHKLILGLLEHYNKSKQEFDKIFAILPDMNDENLNQLVYTLMREYKDLAKVLFEKIHTATSSQFNSPFNYEIMMRITQKIQVLYFEEKYKEVLFTQEEILEMLTNFAKKEHISMLIGRSLILAFQRYGIYDELLKISEILIQKEVWKNKTVWKEIIKLFGQNSDKSIDLILNLPESVQNSLLQK